MHLFYRGLVQHYPSFSNLFKLSFRPWHLLIHESSPPGEVSFEYNAEELGYILMFLANLKESGTGMIHEVGLAALGIDSNIDFRYYYLFTLGKGNGTGVDGPNSSLLNTFIFAANQSSASCTLCC